ncbi:MAG: radical SAM protein [Gammaproteobacteria bacterium]|nr:radical SAM protein [Gammaproteobacteria bacterium]
MSGNYLIDGHKLHFHPQRVAQLLDAENDISKLQTIYPIYVEISPVGACNHRCKFCAVDYIGYQTANKLDTETIKTVISEMAQKGVKSIMFAGEGEPLLHKKIGEIVQHTKSSGIDASFTTNAVPMNDKFIEQAIPYTSWIKASVNAGTEESYAQIHATQARDFKIVINNLKRAVEFRNKHQHECVIGLQAVLLPDNKNDMLTLAKIARDEIGADYLVIKPYSQEPASITTEYKDISYESDFNESLKEQLQQLNTDKFKVNYRSETMALYHEKQENRYSTCYSTPILMSYIMANGSVYGCKDHLFDEKFKYGNINETAFSTIWEGEKRQQNLHYVLNDLDVNKCRVNCRLDKVNRFLFDLKKDKIQHVNFI